MNGTIPVLAMTMGPLHSVQALQALAEEPGVFVERLLVCDTAPDLYYEPSCLIGEMRQLAAAWLLPVGHIVEVKPPPWAPGPVFGEADCGNALAQAAFEDDVAGSGAAAPWALFLNDGTLWFESGTLQSAVGEIRRAPSSASLFIAADADPAVPGAAFGAFVLTSEGYASLGSFDENYFPAYWVS